MNSSLKIPNAIAIAVVGCALFVAVNGTRLACAESKQPAAEVKPKDAKPKEEKLTRLEAAEYKAAFYEARQVQSACESLPEYKKADAALKAALDAIATAHHMNIKPDGSGDRFDPNTLAITRAPITPEKKK